MPRATCQEPISANRASNFSEGGLCTVCRIHNYFILSFIFIFASASLKQLLKFRKKHWLPKTSQRNHPQNSTDPSNTPCFPLQKGPSLVVQKLPNASLSPMEPSKVMTRQSSEASSDGFLEPLRSFQMILQVGIYICTNTISYHSCRHSEKTSYGGYGSNKATAPKKPKKSSWWKEKSLAFASKSPIPSIKPPSHTAHR